MIDEQALGTHQLSEAPRIRVVKDPSINARGGRANDGSGIIILNSGLFDLAGGYGMEGAIKASDILGNVIAHELSHIFYQHPSYGSTSSGARGLLDELLGKTSLDRTQEMEADILGMRVACQAGFNPDGMLEYMRVAARIEGNASSFMKNHPSAIQRLNYLEGEAKKCREVQGR
jgi:predicted Zn-dependent protease